MCDIGLVHDEQVIPERCRAFPSLMDLGVLANGVAVSDDDAIARGIAGKSGVFKASNFGRRPDSGSRSNPVVVANCDRACNRHERPECVALPESNVADYDSRRVNGIHQLCPLDLISLWHRRGITLAR